MQEETAQSVPPLERVKVRGASGRLESVLGGIVMEVGVRVGGLYSEEGVVVRTDDVTDWGGLWEWLCLCSRQRPSWSSCSLRRQGLFSCHGPCLHSWGWVGEVWNMAGRVLIYWVGLHISVLGEDGSVVILCFFSVGLGSFGSCCSGKLSSGAATEAGRS